VAAMPALLSRLASEPIAKGAISMSASENGPDVAEVGKSLLLDKESPGPPTSITCPECGGSLWERRDEKMTRFQCHVGHSYTAESLVEKKSEQLESVLWTALRALEENADLRRRIARRVGKGTSRFHNSMAEQYVKEAHEAEQRAAVLREVLTNGDSLAKLARQSTSARKAKRTPGQSVRTTGKNSRPRRRQKDKSI